MEGATTPETGRHTRAALAEIPDHMERLRVNMSPMILIANRRHHSPAMPSGYLSPAPSPDELVIHQRGRKCLPVTWSPDIELKRNPAMHSVVRTPSKEPVNPSSPNKSGITTRSTPRKRLHLDDTAKVDLTPEKIDFSDMSTPPRFKALIDRPSNSKKRRFEPKRTEYSGMIDTGLKGLSPTQLINMIRDIINKHPEVEQEIRQEMPTPDLGPVIEKLNYLKSNIYRGLPTSRLVSKTDSPAYSRVYTHLTAFKKCVIDQGKMLLESQHWGSVIEYVFLAWAYVRATPRWDNQVHNTTRKQCFKALVSFCMNALKKGNFDLAVLNDIHERLQDLIADSDDVQSCIKYTYSLMKQNSI